MWGEFVGAFADLRKVTISVALPLCPSAHPFVRTEELGCHWKDFHEIWYLYIFSKYVDKNSSFIEI